jgi:hypothetical protein
MGTLVDDGPVPFPSSLWAMIGAPAYNGTTLDAAGEYIAAIVRAPKTGSIRSFGWSNSSATGSPTANLAFETLDSTGFPSGTALNSDTARKNGVAITASTWHEPDFDADASVTRGDLFAMVVRYASGTSFVPRYPWNSNVRNAGMNYCVTNTGTPTKTGSPVAFALRYSDGTYGCIPHAMPHKDGTLSETFDDDPGPNHRGNVYTPPTPRRAMGGWVLIPSSAVDYAFVVATDAWDGTADDDGTSNLAVTVD